MAFSSPHQNGHDELHATPTAAPLLPFGTQLHFNDEQHDTHHATMLTSTPPPRLLPWRRRGSRRGALVTLRWMTL